MAVSLLLSELLVMSGKTTMRSFFIFIIVFSIVVNASISPDDIDKIPSMSDDKLKREIESTTISFDRIYYEYQKLQTQIDELNDKIKEYPFNSDLSDQYRDIIEKKNAKGKNELQPIENKLQLLQREWNRRMNIPEDYKEYESLKKYLGEKYYKGVGTREEMVTKFEELAEKFPDSPIAINALFDAAMLYTGGCIRESGVEPRLPEKAREYHERIVSKYPSLLSEFVVWSRGELAILYPTSDQRFAGQLEFYNWLKNIKPEQYGPTIEFKKRDYRHRNKSDQNLKEQINGLLEGTMDTLKNNIAGSAKASSNPEENMKILEKLFESEFKPDDKVESITNSVETEPVKEKEAVVLWSKPQSITVIIVGTGALSACFYLLTKQKVTTGGR